MILYSSGLLIGCHIQNKTRDKRRHENNLSLLENGRRHAVQTAAVFLSILFRLLSEKYMHLLSSARFFRRVILREGSKPLTLHSRSHTSQAT